MKPFAPSTKTIVTALGTGICTDIDHLEFRDPPGFVITHGDRSILLDCSQLIDRRLKKAGIPLAQVGQIFLSHAHPDHCALPHYIQSAYCDYLFNGAKASGQLGHELTIHVAPDQVTGFYEMMKVQYPEMNGKFWDDFNPSIMPLQISDGTSEASTMSDGVFTVTAYPVYHGFGRCPAFGFRVRIESGGPTIAYTGDAGFESDGSFKSLLELAQNAHLLIADSGTRVGKDYVGGYGHMSAYQCGQLAKEANVDELWLTHYSGLDPIEKMVEEVRRAGFEGIVHVAKDGQIWER